MFREYGFCFPAAGHGSVVLPFTFLLCLSSFLFPLCLPQQVWALNSEKISEVRVLCWQRAIRGRASDRASLRKPCSLLLVPFCIVWIAARLHGSGAEVSLWPWLLYHLCVSISSPHDLRAVLFSACTRLGYLPFLETGRQIAIVSRVYPKALLTTHSSPSPGCLP